MWDVVQGQQPPRSQACCKGLWVAGTAGIGFVLSCPAMPCCVDATPRLYLRSLGHARACTQAPEQQRTTTAHYLSCNSTFAVPQLIEQSWALPS